MVHGVAQDTTTGALVVMPLSCLMDVHVSDKSCCRMDVLGPYSVESGEITARFC